MSVALLAASLSYPASAHDGVHNRFAGWFTFCDFDKRARVDPIVERGVEVSDHHHDFFGGSVNANSTEAQLRNGPTTCTFNSDDPATIRDSGDHSGYWTPSLKHKETLEWITPVGMHVYPRTAVGVSNHNVSSWAPGTEVVFRDNEQGSKYVGADIRWFCADVFPGQGNNGDKRQSPYFCGDPAYPHVAVEIITPGCMKAGTTRWPDDFGHFAYSDPQTGCPSTHPKAVPEMRLVVKYANKNGQQFRMGEPGKQLSQDFHFDFFAAWDPGKLSDLIQNCIHNSVVCGNSN
jgi:hypothetical protein